MNKNNNIIKFEDFSYGGKSPKTVMFPKTTEEISQIMLLANREDKKVVIQGKSTQAGLGGLLQSFDIAVSLSKLNSIIEYDIQNLTITTESGLSLADLQHVVRKRNQFLPLDPPGREKSTLGGIVATNSSGPRRFLYGTCRDLILGMSYVLPDGTYSKIGGKTMKNVAGYDMTKLFIGSMGTLGAIVNITFRLYPLPDKSVTVEIEFAELDSCQKFIDKILASKLIFSSIDLLNSEAITKIKRTKISTKKFNLLIRFEGNQKVIDYSVELLRQQAQTDGGIRINLIQKDFWQDFQRLTLFSSTSENEASVKITLPLSTMAQAISFIESNSKTHKIPITIVCHPGNGIIYASFPVDKSEVEIKNLINELRLRIERLEGHLIIQKIPVEYKKELDVWGTSKSELLMFKKVKSQFDPRQIIASGRFVGGI